jgi:hypothetical protein
MNFAISVRITEILQHLFLQCLEIKPIIEEFSTMIIALCLKWRKYYVGYIFV